MGHMKPNSAEPLDAEDQARRRRRAAASSDDDRLAAFARDLSDSWYSDLPPKLDAGGVSTSNANKKSTFIRLFSHRVKRTTPRGRPANSNERSEGHTRAGTGEDEARAESSDRSEASVHTHSHLAEKVALAQKTHGFLNTLRHRFQKSHSRDREREPSSPRDPVNGSSRTGSVPDVSQKDHSDHGGESSDPSGSTTPSTKSPRKGRAPGGPAAAGSRCSCAGSAMRLGERLRASLSGALERAPRRTRSVRSRRQTLPRPVSRLSDDVLFLCEGDDELNSLTASGSSDSSLAEVSAVSGRICARHPSADPDGDSAQHAALRQHEFFVLDVYLKHGRNLPAMDNSGTSDPYVKFKLGGKVVCKSKIVYKTLNPLWDEWFQIPIDDPYVPLQIKVYDHDWGMNDDFMGEAELDLSTLEPNREQEMTLNLSDSAKSGEQGSITLAANLVPKSKEEREQLAGAGSRSTDSKKLKNQQWSSVVTIVLVEAKDLMAMDSEGTSDPYVKLRLGAEKYKSKVQDRTLTPRWLEQFDMHLYDSGSQILEIEVFDHDARSKDDFMGKTAPAPVFILLTVSGMTNVETISDLLTYQEDPEQVDTIRKQFNLRNTLKQVKEVGHLTVKVFKAMGLASADIGGKSDPFCVLELVNSRLQTQTEYKTLSPQWNKIFFFNVKDIHSVLEVTVYDEDKDHKVEFLGKVSIPLLKIRPGERRWYALKDKKLLGRAKGNNPQVMLEMDLVWNPARAAIRTFNPREEKYTRPELKFKRAVFIRNVNRLKEMGAGFAEGAKFIKSIFDWESKPRTIAAFFAFMLGAYSFELYMAPVALLVVFFKGWVDEKKSLKEKLMAVQEVTAMVQNILGYIASLGECVQNTFNFTVPFLSWLAVLVLSLVAVVLYNVPIRYLVMLFGVHKFSKKLLRPNAIPNNELLDFLSRVPDNDQLRQFRELRPAQVTDAERRREQRMKQSQKKTS
ncbi:Multiple C2 and transmembrane domain-containing protein [Amphibalanus amphitrite]|uniref:Multiple C2 and transmembrane domain-containing protein n=1 Tax=Amphibalanus amphitrite TaxID=1232801 RepID=A0A6A4VG54_AMPAM|nr:Multiple C2 and transmembrane domain-containing protein [Amphibalanus amphitrite]